VAADKEVGIKITAKDLTGKAFASVSSGAKRAADTINKMPKAFKEVSKTLSILTTGVNQAFELWAKIRSRVIEVINATVNASLEFRSATDPMVVWMADQRKEVELIKARIGDALLPAIRGFGEAINEVSGRTSKWIAENRKMLATKVIEWISRFVQGLAQLVRGLGFVAQAGALVKSVFSGILVVANGMIGGILKGFGKLFEGFGAIEKLIPGLRAAGEADQSIGKNLGEWGDVFLSTANDSINSLTQVGAQLDAIAAGADKAALAVENIGSRGAELAGKFVGTDTGAGGTIKKKKLTPEELEAEKKKLKAIEMKYGAQVDAYLTEQAKKRHDMAVKASNESIERLEAERNASLETYKEIGTTMASSLIEGAIAGTEAKDIFKQMLSQMAKLLIDFVTKSIMANAALTASSVAAPAAAQSGIAAPIVVPVIMAAMLAMVQGLISKFALGGVVRGGTAGRDTVPAMLTPGEMVLTPSEARRYQRGAATGQPVSVTIAPQINTLTLPDRAQQRKVVQNLASAIEEAVRDGRLRLVGA
jgi:hypothetical protein